MTGILAAAFGESILLLFYICFYAFLLIVAICLVVSIFVIRSEVTKAREVQELMLQNLRSINDKMTKQT